MKAVLSAAIVAFALVAAVTADSATNNRGDRIAAALSAAQSSIETATASGSESRATRQATLRGMNVARLTTRLSAAPWEFGGRKLLAGGATFSRSDRISQALSASHESIDRTVSAGGKLEGTVAASRNGMVFAKLATKESPDAWEFGGRKLHQHATNSRSDRISQALSASQESIGRVVADGATLESTMAASRNGMAFAKLATKESAAAWEFGGRKLHQHATNSRSDRISQALSASQESIGRVVADGATLESTMAASRKGMAFAKLATKESAAAWEFGGRKLHQHATNSRSDRISQALSASQESIGRVVADGATLESTMAASRNGMAFAKLATKESAAAWEFGGRKLHQHATNSRSDRISQALSASQESIGKSVSAGGRLDATVAASRNGMAFAKLATKESAAAWEFGGRKLHQHATNSRSDRITQALSATSDSITKSVQGGASIDSTVAASRNGITFAKLAAKESTRAWEFDSP